MSTLWHGRFEGGPSEELLAFTVSLPFDQLMWREDIIGSRAHVVGSALDRSGLAGLLGTVAGDDTLLCVAEEEIGGPELAARLKELAGIA